MTQPGSPVTDRTEEIEEYVEQVREALADLPAAQRDELLEDLPAHLTEVATEDPEPLVARLGLPAAYAAELRAALNPAAGEEPPSRQERFLARWERVLGRLRRLDVATGPLIGYERVTDFVRSLRPAWWVLRGYLAAMLVVMLLNQQGPVGLLPRLGGSTIAGLVILAGFVAGSIWLAHRSTDLHRWQRRVVYVASAVLVLFGLAGLAGMDSSQRWGWPSGTVYVSDNPYAHVTDVFVVDSDGDLLTDAQLFDQDGTPIDIGDAWCDSTTEYLRGRGEYSVRYPRCDHLPWWVEALILKENQPPAPSPTAAPLPPPTDGPTASPTSGPSGSPVPQPDSTESPAAGQGGPSGTPAPTTDVATPTLGPTVGPDR